MKKKKNEKLKVRKDNGITLIALVITIIVLLILAGVTIAMLTGDNGILTKANQSRKESTHAVVYEGMLLEITNYFTDKNLGENENNFIDYLKNKSILDNDMVINIDNLLKQTLSLGNGNLTDGDYYTLQEVIESENQYKVVYYGNTKTTEWESDIINLEDAKKKSIGKLSSIVEVGDYINYAPIYTNVSDVSEGLGNGWRVAYVDNTSGVVTLISEGVPLLLEEVGEFSDWQLVGFNFDSMSNLFDNSVANNIDILGLQDINKLCTQANYTLEHQESVSDSTNKQWINEFYHIENDNLKLINIQASYLLNTKGMDGYGNERYFEWRNFCNYYDYIEGKYVDVENVIVSPDVTNANTIRIVVDLKENIEYYGGEGTQENPYQIY